MYMFFGNHIVYRLLNILINDIEVNGVNIIEIKQLLKSLCRNVDQEKNTAQLFFHWGKIAKWRQSTDKITQ